MNTLINSAPSKPVPSTELGRHEHPPQQVQSTQHERSSRRASVGLLDRIALRVGLALIMWGRRRNLQSRERLVQRHEQWIARMERERQHERSLRLTVPLR